MPDIASPQGVANRNVECRQTTKLAIVDKQRPLRAQRYAAPCPRLLMHGTQGSLGVRDPGIFGEPTRRERNVRRSTDKFTVLRHWQIGV